MLAAGGASDMARRLKPVSRPASSAAGGDWFAGGSISPRAARQAAQAQGILAPVMFWKWIGLPAKYSSGVRGGVCSLPSPSASPLVAVPPLGPFVAAMAAMKEAPPPSPSGLPWFWRLELSSLMISRASVGVQYLSLSTSRYPKTAGSRLFGSGLEEKGWALSQLMTTKASVFEGSPAPPVTSIGLS